MEFDLQRFGGGGKKAKVEMPDEYEGELQQAMAQAALRNIGFGNEMMDTASSQIPGIQSTIGERTGIAQDQQSLALGQLLNDLTSSNWDISTITDERLMSLLPQYQQNAEKYAGVQEAIASGLGSNLNQAVSDINSRYGGLSSATDTANQNLLGYKGGNSAVNDSTNAGLLGTLTSDDQATGDYTSNLGQVLQQLQSLTNSANGQYDKYINQNNSGLNRANSDIQGYKGQMTSAVNSQNSAYDTIKSRITRTLQPAIKT